MKCVGTELYYLRKRYGEKQAQSIVLTEANARYLLLLHKLGNKLF